MKEEKEIEKLNKNNNEELFVFNELDNDCNDDDDDNDSIDIYMNDLMKQLRETKENKSLFVHNYRMKQFANLSYTKLYHALINLFEIVPHIQNHQFGNIPSFNVSISFYRCLSL